MPITFYPHLEDSQRGSLEDRIEILMEAAERYKAVVLDDRSKQSPAEPPDPNYRMAPHDIVAAFNWDEIANVLRTIRELPEATRIDKERKAVLLVKLAEVYESLRAAKMSKLEAVRLALISEAKQLNTA
jgi:hypothetical protein